MDMLLGGVLAVVVVVVGERGEKRMAKERVNKPRRERVRGRVEAGERGGEGEGEATVESSWDLLSCS